jgi:hypothetical protein
MIKSYSYEVWILLNPYWAKLQKKKEYEISPQHLEHFLMKKSLSTLMRCKPYVLLNFREKMFSQHFEADYIEAL